jgi:hypothetical protein
MAPEAAFPSKVSIGTCFIVKDGARKIRPSLEADPLCAGSLVRVP